MHTQVLGVAAAAAVVLGLLPGLASGHTVHVLQVAERPGLVSSHSAVSADLSALNAYRAYLAMLTADESSSSARAQQVVQGVSNTCSGALDDLSGLSSGQLSNKALTDFSEEVDGDLDLAYMAAARSAVTKLGSSLAGISWPTTAEDHTTSKFIASERSLAAVSQSDICADATSLDAAPLSEPTATVKFLRRYGAAATGLHSSLSAFQLLVSKYETSGEKKLVAQINAMVSDFSSASSSTEENDATMVLSILGVSSS